MDERINSPKFEMNNYEQLTTKKTLLHEYYPAASRSSDLPILIIPSTPRNLINGFRLT
jgi:hypothetical protein